MKKILYLLSICALIVSLFPVTTRQMYGISHKDMNMRQVYGAVNNLTVQILEENECTLSENDIYLIALVTMAEAEGECEEGKRLVIDTILNRVDSVYFPDTVYDVVYQPNQFTSMSNGRCSRVTVTNEVCELVKEEARNRMNSEVIFFNAYHYSAYGTKMFQLGNHYFSSY